MMLRYISFSLLILLLFFSKDALASEKTIDITEAQAHFIAMKVWQNEGASLDKYLIHWNDGEAFASVGIGHFIWFSKGHSEKFQQVFPRVISLMEISQIKLPDWLNSHTPLPWSSKEELNLAKKSGSKKYLELFDLLKSTKKIQAKYLVNRFNMALPRMLETITDPSLKIVVRQNFHLVLRNTDGTINERGLYALLDYINFKGEGIVTSERYQGQGWGLIQVLENMNLTETNSLNSFALSADKILTRRIKNSPPERGEQRWKKNWHNRVMSYWQ